MFDPAAMPIRSCIRPIDELLSNCGPPHRKNVRFADSTTVVTNHLETSPIHPRAWRIKRSTPIPDNPLPHLLPTTPLTLISGNKKVVRTKTVRFSFIERALLPNGQISESVISFNDSETNELWKPGALDDKLFMMNCQTTR